MKSCRQARIKAHTDWHRPPRRGVTKRGDVLVGSACLVVLAGLIAAAFVVLQSSFRSQRTPRATTAANGVAVIVMQHIGELAKQEQEPESLAVSNDGKMIATGAVDGSVAVWDVARGRLKHRFTGHSEPVRCLAFLLDGRVVSGGSDGTLRIQNAEGFEAGHIDLSGGRISAMAGYPYGPFVLVASADHGLRLVDVERRRVFREYAAGEGCVTAVAFARNGKSFATGTNSGQIALWAVAQTTKVASLEVEGQSLCGVTLSNDATEGVCLSETGALFAVDWRTPSLRETFRSPPGEHVVTGFAVSSGGTFALTSSTDHRLHYWRFSSGHRGVSPMEHTQQVNACGLSPDGLFGYSAGADGLLHAWAMPTPTQAEVEAAKASLDLGLREGKDRERFAAQMRRGQEAAESGNMAEARREIGAAQHVLPSDTLEHAVAQTALDDLETGASTQRNEYVQHMERGKQALENDDEGTARREFLAAKKISPNRPEADEGLSQIERARELKGLLGTAKTKPDLQFDFTPGPDRLQQGSDFAYLFDEDELAKARQGAFLLVRSRQEPPQPPLGLITSPLVWAVEVVTSRPIPEPNLKIRLRLQDAEFKHVFAEQDYILKQGTMIQQINGRAKAPADGWKSGRYAFRYFLVTESSERELGVPRRFSIGLLRWTRNTMVLKPGDVQETPQYIVRTGVTMQAEEPYRVDAVGSISPVSRTLIREIAGREIQSIGPDGVVPVQRNPNLSKYQVIARDLPFAALIYKLDPQPAAAWQRYEHRTSRGLSPRSGELFVSINSIIATRPRPHPSVKFTPVSRSNHAYWQNHGEFQLTLYIGRFEFPVTLNSSEKQHLLKPFF